MRIILIFITLISFNLSFFAQEDPSDCEFEVSRKSEKLYKKALDELKLGHFKNGNDLLEDAIADSPEYLKALWVLADLNNRITNRTRKENIAIESYKKIIELCPSHQDFYSYYYLGKMYYNKENWHDAYTNLELFLGAETNKIHEKHFEDAVDLSKYAKFYDEMYNNPVPFDPILVNDVSSTNDEYLPSLSPDNEFIYFTRRFPKTIDRIQNYNQPRDEKFCVSKIIANKRFEVGAPMESPFNVQSNEGGATLTIDNKELFYTRCVIKGKTLNCDICYSKFEGGYWSEIEVLGNEINTPDNWESMPSISSDGKTLFFVSNRPGGFGGHDIYKSEKDSTGKWSKAVNMGPSINTAGNEKSPFIHTDSKTLYFSSSDRKDENSGDWFAGQLGLGGYDIFYTRLDDTNQWITPKNIGYPINSTDNDLGFFVSTDGENGYFASNKLSPAEKKANENEPAKEVWNIYTFKLYKKAQPQKILFIKGELKDEETHELIRDAKIVVKNMDTKEVKEVKVDNETGKYVYTTIMKSDYTVTVKKRDYTYITKYISKDDPHFSIPVEMNMQMKAIEVGKSYNLEDVYFDTDSDQLTEASKKVVEGFFDFLKDNPNVIIEIQGHTDNVGADEYNMTLSQNRAKSVYQLLITLGIPNRQMTFKGFGESKPIDTNETEEGRAKNRRTVFLIVKK